MKRHQSITGVIFAIGIICITACGRSASTPRAGGGLTQAPVSEVEVLQVVGDTTKVRVLARGELPDGCYQLGQAVVQRGGSLFAVILPVQPVNLRECSPDPQPYERVIALDMASLPPGHYEALVNGVPVGFDLVGAQAAITPLPSSTAAEAATRVAPVEITPTLPVEVEPTAVGDKPTVTPTVEETQAAAETQAGAETPVIVISPTPPDPVTQAGSSGLAEPCINKAAFYEDVTVPDGTLFDPGQAFVKTWRVRNAGSCTWEGYALIFRGGERLTSVERQPLGQAVAPGEIMDVSLNMTAPERPGGYLSEWQIAAPEGVVFGVGATGSGTLWTKIGVRTLVPVTSGPAVTGPQINCAWRPVAGYAEQVLSQMNQVRQERGLRTLQLNEQLSGAALVHSQDMTCNDFVEHYGSDGSNPFSRIQALGIRYKSASENIYAGNPDYGGTPEGAMNWWMNSQIHREAILNPKFAWVGIGYAYYEGSTYKGYFTVKFVEP